MLDLLELNVVGGRSVLPLAGGVEDDNDRVLVTHQNGENSLDLLLNLGLPLFRRQTTRVLRQTRDGEAVLEPDVLLIVKQLRVFGRLHLNGGVQAAVVLLESNHPVLEEAGRLGGSRTGVLE